MKSSCRVRIMSLFILKRVRILSRIWLRIVDSHNLSIDLLFKKIINYYFKENMFFKNFDSLKI